MVQAVHDQLRELVEEHKENKEEEPLMVSKGAVKCVLLSCGVSESHVSAFDSRYDDSFGADTRLSPRNLVDARQVQLSMPDVTIRSLRPTALWWRPAPSTGRSMSSSPQRARWRSTVFPSISTADSLKPGIAS